MVGFIAEMPIKPFFQQKKNVGFQQYDQKLPAVRGEKGEGGKGGGGKSSPLFLSVRGKSTFHRPPSTKDGGW